MSTGEDLLALLAGALRNRQSEAPAPAEAPVDIQDSDHCGDQEVCFLGSQSEMATKRKAVVVPKKRKTQAWANCNLCKSDFRVLREGTCRGFVCDKCQRKEVRYTTKESAIHALRFSGPWVLRHASEEVRSDPEVVIAAAEAYVTSVSSDYRGPRSGKDDRFSFEVKYEKLQRKVREFVDDDTPGHMRRAREAVAALRAENERLRSEQTVDAPGYMRRARNAVAELRAENERLRSEQTVEVFDVDADVVTREQKRPRTEPSSALKAVADIADEFSAKNVDVKRERDAATQRANAAEDRLECCVCQDAAHQVMLGPCRHLCCCATCAPALSECPICRTPVESRTAVFF